MQIGEPRCCPINALPEELLVQLLQTVLDPYREEYGSAYYQNLHRLVAVCRWWKSILDNHGTFWSIIPYGPPDEVVETLLYKSQSSPLMIVCSATDNMEAWRQKPRDWWDGTPHFLEMTGKHSHRWKSASFKFANNLWDDLGSSFRLSAPLLEKLTVQIGFGERIVRPTDPVWDVFDGELPRLRHLHGISASFPIRYCSQLRSLSLFAVVHATGSQHLLEMLQSASHLVELSLVSLRFPVEDTLPEDTFPIVLPHLIDLRVLLSPIHGAYILSRLRIPNCKHPHFTLCFTVGESPQTKFAHLGEVLVQSMKRSNIVDVEFDDGWWHIGENVRGNRTQWRERFKCMIKGPGSLSSLRWINSMLRDAAPPSVTLRRLPMGQGAARNDWVSEISQIPNVHRLDVYLTSTHAISSQELFEVLAASDRSALLPNLRYLVLYSIGQSLQSTLNMLERRYGSSSDWSGVGRSQLDLLVLRERGDLDKEHWRGIQAALGPEIAIQHLVTDQERFPLANVPHDWIVENSRGCANRIDR